MRDAHEARAPFDDRLAAGSRIGLAWRTIPADGPDGERVIIEHGGNSAGSSARIAFDPDRGVGFVRLTNVGSFSDDIGLYMLRTGPPNGDPAVDVSREVLEGYAGAYRFAPGAELYIRFDDRGGWLTSQLGPTVRFRMYADSDTSFYLKRIPTRFAFRADATGEVEAAVLQPGPRQRVMPKVSDETPDPHLPVPEILDRPLTAAELVVYEGAWLLDGETRTLELELHGDDGRLAGQLADGTRFRLRYQGDHAFIPERDPASRVVFRVRDGRAVGLELNLRGSVLTGRRSDTPPADSSSSDIPRTP